jgi:hypothetical protein
MSSGNFLDRRSDKQSITLLAKLLAAGVIELIEGGHLNLEEEVTLLNAAKAMRDYPYEPDHQSK